MNSDQPDPVWLYPVAIGAVTDREREAVRACLYDQPFHWSIVAGHVVSFTSVFDAAEYLSIPADMVVTLFSLLNSVQAVDWDAELRTITQSIPLSECTHLLSENPAYKEIREWAATHPLARS